MKKDRNIIVYVMGFPSDVTSSLKEYKEITGQKLKTLLLWDSRLKNKTHDDYPTADIFLKCDFSKPNKIAEALLPYQEQLLAITCRSEQHMRRFSEVIPHVPYLRTPTTESLEWASDKYEMRKRMRLFDASITPKFALVRENSKQERTRIRERIGFPLIIKPANLAGSRFVSICYHEEELEKSLRNIFRRIRKAYQNESKLEIPKILAEEYMDGDMYSLDSYVSSRGKVYHCPLVKVVTGKMIGHDDFYNYSQMTPTVLKKSTIEKAECAAETAVHSLGLRNTTTHTELMKIDDEWKVIEVGARIGGFRHALHTLSCDINHTLNDVMIRIPKKPIVPKKCKGYAVALKFFAEKEGEILELKGVKRLEALKSCKSVSIKKKVRDRSVFARNGGKAIIEVMMYNKEHSKLLADIRRAEKLIQIKVKRKGQHAKTT